MNSDSDNESETSLPSQPILTFPSSPPVPKQSDVSFEKLDEMDEMDGAPGPKSEPPTPQNHEAPLRRVSLEETERPPSAQQSNKNFAHEEEEDEVDEEETDEDEIDSDPAEQISEFNWDELHQRYHDVMNNCHIQEGQLAQEWESLMNYFRVWAESGHDHETDRTFQRLKTRTSYVQHSEATLEQKRNHYISVVKAFESALSLLKATSFAR